MAVGEQRAERLAAPAPVKADAHGRARGSSDGAALDEALQIHGDVEARGGQAPPQRQQLAERGAHRARPPRPPPAARVGNDNLVERGMAPQDGRLAPLGDPGQPGMRARGAQRGRYRQRMDDVAQRGELDQRDARGVSGHRRASGSAR